MGARGLESLDGLDAIDSVNWLQIQNNPDLSDISALTALGYVEKVSIVNNRALLTSDAEAMVASIDELESSATVRGNMP